MPWIYLKKIPLQSSEDQRSNAGRKTNRKPTMTAAVVRAEVVAGGAAAVVLIEVKSAAAKNTYEKNLLHPPVYPFLALKKDKV